MKKNVILYVHGKDGSAEEAEHYRVICPRYDLFGLDYKGSTPWETQEEFQSAYDRLVRIYDSITLLANSIGAYFTMNALGDRSIERALFISPVVDMECLISDMMRRTGVTEAELQEKQEIETAFGETLSWRYLCYVREHPIHWDIPTNILYADGDSLISYAMVSAFTEKTGATLTVMEHGEHWFHTPEQMAFLDTWVKVQLYGS